MSKELIEDCYHCNLTVSNLPYPEASIVDYIYAVLILEDQAQSLLGVFVGNPTKTVKQHEIVFDNI
jgi:hypothetical protein